MTMYNRTTGQQGEWVTIENMEFLEVDGGNYIKKENVGDDWMEFNDETTQRLLELADRVRSDEDVHFFLVNHVGDGAEVIGHKVSDKMMLSLIMVMIEHFIEDDPIKMVMIMMVIQGLVEGDDE